MTVAAGALCCCVVSIVGGAQAASAPLQDATDPVYRDNVPAVMQPDATGRKLQAETLQPAQSVAGKSELDPRLQQRFAANYAAAGSPVVLVLWNTSVSGGLAAGDYTAPLTGTEQSALQHYFMRALLGAGVKLVDAALANRKAAVMATERSERKHFADEVTPNGQLVEAVAMETYARYILEVLPAAAASPVDNADVASFRLRMLDSGNGQIALDTTATIPVRSRVFPDQLTITDSGYAYRPQYRTLLPGQVADAIAAAWLSAF